MCTIAVKNQIWNVRRNKTTEIYCCRSVLPISSLRHTQLGDYLNRPVYYNHARAIFRDSLTGVLFRSTVCTVVTPSLHLRPYCIHLCWVIQSINGYYAIDFKTYTFHMVQNFLSDGCTYTKRFVSYLLIQCI